MQFDVNIRLYEYIKRIKTSIDDRHCRGKTTHRQNKLWQFIANIMIYIKIYIIMKFDDEK
jgi:hypothetical protein